MKIIITNEPYFLETFSIEELISFKKSIANEVTKSLESELGIPVNLAINREGHSMAMEIFVLTRYIRGTNRSYYYYEYVGGVS